MILFVSSWSHAQAQRIASLLGHAEHTHIDPHTIAEQNRSFGLAIEHGKTQVMLDDKAIDLTAIYWNSRPRIDAAQAPPKTRFAGAYRSRLTQFVDDLSLAMEHVPQFPGSLQTITRAESKPLIQRAAAQSGLRTPTFTWNAIGSSLANAVYRKHGRSYRKVLGSPCIVTEDGYGVTTTNLAVNEWSKDLPGFNHPWQYQEIIPFVAQIRCQVIGSSVWAVRWEHSPHGDEWDLRYHQEILGETLHFEPAQIDPKSTAALVALTRSLGLTHAAPELLERADGSLVFIDLNPCGDWMGFFQQQMEEEIASALAKQLVSF